MATKMMIKDDHQNHQWRSKDGVGEPSWRAAAVGSGTPNLTEPLDIDRNEEYGQQRNCPSWPLF